MPRIAEPTEWLSLIDVSGPFLAGKVLEEAFPQGLDKSLAFQEEVTDTLGEQVRRAVEVLVQTLGRADQDRNGELLKDVRSEELYEAGLTVMMRLVFILSAEQRDLLLLGDPVYDQHYAFSTLRARLHEDADQFGVEVLERRHDAWSRILSVFRMVYGGVDREALRMPALGGSLFDPDRFGFLEGRSKSAMKKALEKGGDESDLVALIRACGGDEVLARRLLPFVPLIQTDSWETLLVYRKGAFAIVPGSDRRETGTHYTPRSLTETIVEKTLEPMVYVGPAEGLPREEWKLKTPAELLDLKICDPAMGSGAFLVEVCRYLSHRLVGAWRGEEDAGRVVTAEGEVVDRLENREPLPNSLDGRLILARRLVADRCLYGVDKNPLAVDLAKLSIWLVTLSKNRPFAFLDHALRSGDSLVGLSEIRQLEQFALNEEDGISFSAQLVLAFLELPECESSRRI